MYKIYFSPIDLEGDVQEYTFFDEPETLRKIYDLIYEGLEYVIGKHFVVLIAVDDEIFISDTQSVCDTLVAFSGLFTEFYTVEEGASMDFYVQFYKSYEEAYKVALDMKEPNPLCYE